MTPLLAPRLRLGDMIGFFSPSSPATNYAPRRFARSMAYLEKQGFQLKPGKLTGCADGYRSGTIQERADELNALINDREVRCIMSTIGGSNSNSLLPYLDYEALKADPKIIIGYSDVTAILLSIYAQTGLKTFYGPAFVASFGELPPLVDQTFAYFWESVGSGAEVQRLRMPSHWTEEYIPWEIQDRTKTLVPNDISFHGSGRVKGRLIGGNLNTIFGFWGSPFMPEIRSGDILFIEDSAKSIATVEKLFSFLKVNGVFDKISALLFGKHDLFDDDGLGRTPLMVLREVLNGQELKIVSRFDCAHTHPMMTLPLGGEVDIDFDREVIEVACAVA